MPPMQYHQRTDTGACATCGVLISRHAWAAYCPGVRWYAWEQIPPELATRTTLAREGLRPAPGQGPAGYYVAWEYRAYRPLYDRRQAIAKRAARSEREQAARAQSGRRLLALRTCAACGRVMRARRDITQGEPGQPGEMGRRLCAACHALAALYGEARELLADAARNAAGEGGRPLRVLDTETTGLGEQDEPIELAIVDGVSGAVLLDTRMRPSEPISPGAYAVHGISASELEGAPALADVWPRVRELLAGAHVVAYNAAFDKQMLAQAAARYRLKRPSCRWYCLMEACTVLDGPDNEHWLSLGDVCAALDVAGEGPAHGALADALTARAVLHALAMRSGAPAGQEAAAVGALDPGAGASSPA